MPPKPQPEKTKNKLDCVGYIYLIGGASAVKLGFSIHPQKRLHQLSRWQGELSRIALYKGTLGYEQWLHKLLHNTGKYLSEEWYPIARKVEIINILHICHSQGVAAAARYSREQNHQANIRAVTDSELFRCIEAQKITPITRLGALRTG